MLNNLDWNVSKPTSEVKFNLLRLIAHCCKHLDVENDQANYEKVEKMLDPLFKNVRTTACGPYIGRVMKIAEKLTIAKKTISTVTSHAYKEVLKQLEL